MPGPHDHSFHAKWGMNSLLKLSVLMSISLLPVFFAGSSLSAQENQELYYYNEFGNQINLNVVGQDPVGLRQVIKGPQVTKENGGVAIPEPTVFGLTNQFVIRAKAGSDVIQLANQWGVSLVGQFNWSNDHYILEGTNGLQALAAANGAFERGEVDQVFTQFSQVRSNRQIPNDPSFGNQWHLRNTGQTGGLSGHDINVEPVWNFTAGTGLGTGVLIGIVDDRPLATHGDLSGNYRADRSQWMGGSANFHGTAVAGLASAVGNNGLGVSGVAPNSRWAGIALLNQSGTDANEATALSVHFNTMSGTQFDGIHIYNNSWGPIDNGTRNAAGPLTRSAIETAVTTGRSGLGNIYVWAGGNGGNIDNVNYDGFANSRYTIAVGATTHNGVRASYSERGAALFVNAMGDGDGRGITTTSSNGGYTNGFGGTSSASPIVAGVVALMLEANPNLGWRDVQHILAQTSTQTDPGNSSWITNGAGLRHSDFYGFGTVDAQAAVNAASGWANVGEALVSSGSATVNTTLADGAGNLDNPIFGAPVFSSIMIEDQLRLEHVEVILNTTGGYAGDLEVMLLSPMGTESILASLHPDGRAYQNWQFMTVKNWGENSQGEWTLRLRDGWLGDTTTWLNWSISVHGTAIPEPASGFMFSVILAWIVLRRRDKVEFL